MSKQLPPRLAICGPGRSGKDIAANTIAQVLGVKYGRSTSEAATQVVWEEWGQRLQKSQLPDGPNAESPEAASTVYDSCEAMFADRSRHRTTWAEIIRKYNQPDGLRLYRDMITAGETILCGIRRLSELQACQTSRLVDLTIWIDRPDCEDVTCEVTAEHCDLCVLNWGSEAQFIAKLQRLARWLV